MKKKTLTIEIFKNYIYRNNEWFQIYKKKTKQTIYLNSMTRERKKGVIIVLFEVKKSKK